MHFSYFFRYAVPDIPYTIDAGVTILELNKLLITLLSESSDDKLNTDFDFLVKGEFLK